MLQSRRLLRWCVLLLHCAVFSNNIEQILHPFCEVEWIKCVQFSAALSNDRKSPTSNVLFISWSCLSEAHILVCNVRADQSEKFLAVSRIHMTRVVVGFGISHSGLQRCLAAPKRGWSQMHDCTQQDLITCCFQCFFFTMVAMAIADKPCFS